MASEVYESLLSMQVGANNPNSSVRCRDAWNHSRLEQSQPGIRTGST